MNYEKSCGAIIIKDNMVLLIKQTNGDWGFPKGHMETSETEEMTAIREVKEEVGLDILIDSNKKYMISYSPKENTWKDVVYFLAYLKNDMNIVLQEDEISDYEWININKAISKFTYDDIKELWQKVLTDLNK